MWVTLLGPVSARSGEVELSLGGLKQRAVFALLTLNANRVTSMDRLIDELWHDEPPAQATVTLRSYVSRLRRVLEGSGASIDTRPPGWVLRIPPDAVDAVRFATLLGEARPLAESGAADADLACTQVAEALDQWSGEPLADLAALGFAREEAARLDDLRQQATELLFDAQLAAGRHAEVIDPARQFVASHPYRERGWCALMLALYRSGQQSEAIATFARLRTTLVDELGLDPSPAARELEGRILRQDPALVGPSARPGPSALAGPSLLPGPSVLPGRNGLTVPDAPRPEAALLGRADVLAQLDAAVAAARSGIGRLLILEASAGSGKSAVLQALADRMTAVGGTVVEGNGVGDESMPALWPWVTILRQLVDRRPELGRTLDQPDSAMAAALALVGPGSAATGEDALLTRTTLYRGIVDLLLAGRRPGPLAVLVDDLQWVDRDSLTLLALAVDQLVPAGVVFAVAVRTDEAKVAAIARLVETLRRDLLTRIDLRPLTVDEVSALTRSIAEREPQPELVEAIYARSLGNPLFVTELVRLLTAEGRFTAHAARTALPAGVREVLQRRIDRLPKETVTLLSVASLVSPAVLDVELLAAVTGFTEDAVLDGCEAALLSGLLVENADVPDRFALSHDLVRQTLSAGLSDARRVRLHAKIAAALQARDLTAPQYLVEVAKQLTAAAPAVGAAAAIPYLISASEDALSRYANESAAATLLTALELASSIADPVVRQSWAGQVRGLLASVRTWTGLAVSDWPAGTAEPELPRPTDGVAAAGWLGAVINLGVSGRYDWVCAVARAVLAGAPSLSGQVAGRFALGWASFVRGDLDTTERELAILDGLIADGVDVMLPGALFHLAESVAGYRALTAHARGDEGIADAQLRLAGERAADSERGLLNVQLYGCLLAAMRGDPTEAARYATASDRLSRRLDFAVFAILTGVIDGWAGALLDPEAVDRLDDAFATYEATGIRLFTPTFLLLRAEARCTRDPVAASALVVASRRATVDLGEVCVSPRLTALAETLVPTGS